MTALDRVNPVTRLAAAGILGLPLVFTLDVVSAAVALGLSLVGLLAVGFRPGTILRRTWPVLVAAPVAATSMLLYGGAGGRSYAQWGLIHVTDHSVTLAAAVLLRGLALGVPTVMLLVGLDPTDLADGLAQVARLPSRFVLGSLAGLRLVDRLADDWRTLALARRARGLGDHQALRRWFTMAFALLVLALRRGSTLATAMEARGFGADVPRTWARTSGVGRPDALLVLACLGLVVAALGAAAVAGTFHLVGT